MSTKVTVIIPAYNEEKTIGNIIDIASEVSCVDEIIVVDDASTDMTAFEVKNRKACIYLTHSYNQGKAYCVDKGIHHAKNNIICLLDADIVGLTKESLASIIEPVINQKYQMYIGLRDRRVYWSNKFFRFVPLIGGERVFDKSLWNSIPAKYKNGYTMEIAMNYFTKFHYKKMGWHVVSGLHHTIKEKKYGFWRGIQGRLKLYYDIVKITWQLYFLYSLGYIMHSYHKKKAWKHVSNITFH